MAQPVLHQDNGNAISFREVEKLPKIGPAEERESSNSSGFSTSETACIVMQTNNILTSHVGFEGFVGGDRHAVAGFVFFVTVVSEDVSYFDFVSGNEFVEPTP